MENVYLVAGLGNPGPEYAATRHNAGYLLIEKLAARWRADWRDERRFKARLAQVDWNGRRVFLCMPQTYMNASGEAVEALISFYKIPLTNLLVVVDDADLALGGIRLRPKGGTGGHHGLESIEQHAVSNDFARLRIGIAPEPRAAGSREISGFVLGRFARHEQALLDNVLNRAADQVECWLQHGVAKAMNDYNGVINAPQNEGN